MSVTIPLKGKNKLEITAAGVLDNFETKSIFWKMKFDTLLFDIQSMYRITIAHYRRFFMIDKQVRRVRIKTIFV